MRNKHNIQALIDKYDEGLTSKHEEEWLRQAFRKMKHDELPEEWRAYQAIFAYIDRQQTPLSCRKHTAVNRRAINIRLWFAAAAASLAMLLTFHFDKKATTGYAVIDGVRTENPDIVRQEALEALSQVSRGDDNCFEALKCINLREEQQKD